MKTKQNTVWFVTGASKGLGLVIAQKLLAAGYRVAATSRSEAELVAKLGPASDRFLPLQLDLGDEAAVAAGVATVRGHFGGLDVVVNNAGYGQLGTVEEVTDSEARKNFDVNVFGVLNVLRAALPHLRAQRSGHVFNISSIGGYTADFAGWGIYCATKFALSGLTEGLRADLKPFDVDVTLVYPGYFRTEFLSSGSVGKPSRPIADYQAARDSERAHLDDINHNQPGDPAKLAEALIQTYQHAAPPLHLFMGSDAVSIAETKQAQVTADLNAFRAVSVSTDYKTA